MEPLLLWWDATRRFYGFNPFRQPFSTARPSGYLPIDEHDGLMTCIPDDALGRVKLRESGSAARILFGGFGMRGGINRSMCRRRMAERWDG